MTSQTQTLLEQLSELMAHADSLNLQEQTLIDGAIPEDVKAKIADIRIEFAPQREALENQILAVKEQITAAVIAEGASVTGGQMQAVFQKGRTSWDTKKLDGLMIVLPELAQARKVGEPFVQLKMRGDK